MEPQKDAQTVTKDGARVGDLIAGVQVREAVTHLDERGELTEIFDPAWGFTDFPLVYAYMTTVRPGKVKGWVSHRGQTDRLFTVCGRIRFVFYDGRDASPTNGLVNSFVFGE